MRHLLICIAVMALASEGVAAPREPIPIILDTDLSGDDPGTGVDTKVQLQDLPYPPHGQSLRRHPRSLHRLLWGNMDPGEHWPAKRSLLPGCPLFA